MTASRRASLPLVAVLLGNDEHRFDRLVRWAGELASMGDCRCFVQLGSTPLPGLLPSGVEGTAMLDAAALAALLDRADCVVTHGGPGSVMAARDAGHRPVVVPRDPALGEHADAHQQHFADILARSGVVVQVDSQTEFERAVHEALRGDRGPRGVAAAAPSVTDRFAALAERVARTARPGTCVR